MCYKLNRIKIIYNGFDAEQGKLADLLKILMKKIQNAKS